MGRLRKYITSDIACTIYKQTILPLVEYADLLVESGPPDKVTRLQKLQDRAICIVDDGRHSKLDIDVVSNLYRITPLKIRRAEHMSLVMFRLKNDPTRIEAARPTIHLRGRNKIKFKNIKGRMKGICVVFFIKELLCGTGLRRRCRGRRQRLNSRERSNHI